MTLDREQEHQHEDVDTPARADRSAPGRSSVSTDLRAPEHPVPSGIVMRKSDGAEVAADADAAVAQAQTSSGQELPADLRARFETSLDTDLSSVRVHTGADSQAAADSVAAHAYTIGDDIHFADGQYDPSSQSGQQLLAHEVAHTVQQRGGSPQRQNKLAVSTSADAAELEADRAADAMVSGASASVTSAGGSVIARKGKGESRPLTPDDKNRLANASQLLGKAKGNLDKATTALTAYSAEAPGLLSEIKTTFDATVKIYKEQFKRVNDIIAKAKAIYQIQIQILTAIIDAASGPVMNKLTELTTKTTAAYEALNAGEKALVDSMRSASSLDALKSFQDAASKDTGGNSDRPIDAVKDEAKKKAGADTDGPEASDGSGDMELAFYQTYAGMQGKANQLLPIALGVAKLGGPLAEASTFVKVMSQDEKTRPDKSPQDVETDAAHVWDGSSSIGKAAPTVTAALADLKSTAKQGKASKPKNDMEIQKELWVKWAAGLSATNTDMLDLDVIEDHLKKIGIWDQLGLDIGDWMSDKDEALAVCSAKAQEMVLAHKGEVVEVANDHTGYTRCTLDGLGTMPARFESGASGARVRAVVVSAKTMGPLDESILASRNKNTIAEKLIKDGLVEVVLRAYETIDEPAEEGADGANAP